MSMVFERMAKMLASGLSGFMVAALFFCVGASSAQAEMVVEKNKIYIGKAYSRKLTKNPKSCRRQCADDRRCQGFTAQRKGPLGFECRLFSDVPRGFGNNCCVSGFKKEEPQRAQGKRGKRFKICRDWAETAVEFNERNDQNQCGYHGQAWHSNVQRHIRRCMRLGPKQLRQERRGQKQAIASCVEELEFGKRARCEHYANIAVVQNRSRVKSACGGDRKWAGDYKTHYRWCLRAGPKEARIASAERNKFLRGCFAFERKGPCDDYAKDAIFQFRKNLEKGCDLHGVTWHNNYRRHVSWCRKNTPKQRRRATSQRRVVLKTCKLFGKIGIQWR